MTISLTTPSKLRELQSKLYRKAKNEFPVPSRGTRPSAMKWCLGTRSPVASRCPSELSFVSLAVKPVGKPDAGNPHVRFDDGDGKRGGAQASVLAPILDSTNLNAIRPARGNGRAALV